MELATIDKIDFGKNDGKNEAEKDNFFALYYDDRNYYNKLKNDNYFLITGLKGSGKTLLANYFAKNKEKEKNCNVETLYAVDFVEEKLLSFSKNEINQEELTIFWKYIYLRNIGKMICERVNKLPIYKFKIYHKRKIKNLESLLGEIQLMVDSSEFFSEQERSTGNEISATFKGNTFQAEGRGVGQEKKTLSQTNQMKKKIYYELISDLEKEVIANINSKHEYYVIYDDLDQLEEQMEMDKFLNLMKSMVYAADNMNSKFRKKNQKARIIHVIRSDIREMLFDDSNNIQKIFVDFGVNIDWFSARLASPHNHPIMKMLLHKIKNSIPTYAELGNEELYRHLFIGDEQILDFLLLHSFGRPREIIQFMLIYQERFPSVKMIYKNNLVDCLPSYSEWLYGAALSELKIVKDSENVKNTLALIKERGHKNFTLSKLTEFMNNNSKIKVEDLLGTLQIMYKLGLVGTRNKNGSIEFFFRTNVNSLPKDYNKFIVHFGLLKHLNLY